MTEANASADPSPVLEIDALTKRFRSVVAVEDLSVEIASGELVGLIGPNGAGKSTMMGCIAGTLAADDGHVSVDGVDVADDPVGVRRRVGVAPQELELHEYLTGEELLEFVADLRGLDVERRSTRIEELLEMTTLRDARDRLVREYSGGMRRKLAVASALLGPPRLLLLDEAFVGLDPESAHELRAELAGFCGDGGAVLLSSHSLEMLREMASRILILDEGRLVRDLTADEIDEAVDAGEADNLTDIYLRATRADGTSLESSPS